MKHLIHSPRLAVVFNVTIMTTDGILPAFKRFVPVTDLTTPLSTPSTSSRSLRHTSGEIHICLFGYMNLYLPLRISHVYEQNKSKRRNFVSLFSLRYTPQRITYFRKIQTPPLSLFWFFLKIFLCFIFVILFFGAYLILNDNIFSTL